MNLSSSITGFQSPCQRWTAVVSKSTKSTIRTAIPVLTDFDLHLLGEGTHFRLYEKLGARVIEHAGVKGVCFAVW